MHRQKKTTFLCNILLHLTVRFILMSLYRVSPLPINEIEVFRQQSDSISIPSSPSYGIDAPLGLLASNIFAPLYLYATLRGKFKAWETLLHDVAKDIDLHEPCLDCGCGRGMVLLMIGHLKKRLVTTNNQMYIKFIFRFSS